MSSDFHFLVPESFHTKSGSDLGKSSLNFLTSGSGEEDFQRFLPYMGVAAILVM